MSSRSLIDRYLLGNITAEESQELDRLLAKDPKLRREFVLAAATESGLREVAFERAAEPVKTRSPAAATTKKYLWAAALLSIAASVAVVLGFRWKFSGPTSIATLASAENAAWESSLPTMPGSELASGLLNLKSGVATVRFHSGAEVVLEAPAQLELLSPMRGKLLAGAATIDVPEPAIGFVIETPDGYAVDYGTQFAVRVDQQGKQSDFEIIEGEIAVHHPPSGEEVRLTSQGKTATISQQSLVVIDSDMQENRAEQPSNVIRIGTSGRSGSALRNNKRNKFIHPEVLSVKRTNSGNWDHRSFFAFDLPAVNLDQVASVRLRLNLIPSTRGLASRLPKINRFGVYGLTNPAKKDWKTDCLWEEAPGPEDGVLLGTFEIPRSRQRGSFGMENDELLDFLKANRDAPVTLILVRETTQMAGAGSGMTHMFASDSHPESVGPMLEFSLMEQP